MTKLIDTLLLFTVDMFRDDTPYKLVKFNGQLYRFYNDARIEIVN